MDALAALTRSDDEFLARVDQLTTDQWTMPTNCGDWTVDGLVRHIIGGCTMAVGLLAGGNRDDALAALNGGGQLEGDVVTLLRTSMAAQSAAANEPGAMEAKVHHPAADMSGADLIGFRVVDVTMHTWDLSRSLGLDERLDHELVEYTWQFLQPIAPFIGQIGVFGAGPSGDLTDADPLQTRLLDLTGRRP